MIDTNIYQPNKHKKFNTSVILKRLEVNGVGRKNDWKPKNSLTLTAIKKRIVATKIQTNDELNNLLRAMESLAAKKIKAWGIPKPNINANNSIEEV